MLDSTDKYFITGNLAEDGQILDLPVLKSGELKSSFRGGYHIHTMSQKDYLLSENLTYLTLSSRVELEVGETVIPIPFKIKGEIKDVKIFKLSPYSVTTNGLTLVKIHPRIPYRLKASDGTPYHSFEMLQTPDFYRNPNEMHSDFILLPDKEKSKLNKINNISEWAMLERNSRVIRFPGIVLFSENCSLRIPGWLAKEFNGSPEFGFAYSPCIEPRKDEVLHYHQEIMEPYLGIKGRTPIFIATEEGSETLTITDLKGKSQDFKGEIFEIGKGDVLIPLPKTPHKILFDKRASLPFTFYCINYAIKPLNQVSLVDRVVLEKQ